jgi:hypothetical protein
MLVEIEQHIVVVRIIHVDLERVDTDDGPVLLVPFFNFLTELAPFASTKTS